MRPTRLAIVDDSSFVREGLARLLEGETRIKVVGAAASGEELLAEFGRWKPDVVTLDLIMPGLGGLKTLDRIMEIGPTPVIILSTHSGEGAPLTLEALSRGAVDFIDKEAYSLVDFQTLRAVLVEKVLSVTQGGAPGRRRDSTPDSAASIATRRARSVRGRAGYDLVVIGASTGGPSAIGRVLADLGPGIPAPIVVAQHMPAGFTAAFAERLNSQLPFPVRETVDRERISGGTVYVAPGDRQLTLGKDGNGLYAMVNEAAADATYHPSVDVLFTSAVEVLGERIVAVLLTGMGDDGARGMSRLSDARAYTIGQDQESCAVYGMPRAAVALKAVRDVLPLDRIGRRVRFLFADRAA